MICMNNGKYWRLLIVLVMSIANMVAAGSPVLAFDTEAANAAAAEACSGNALRRGCDPPSGGERASRWAYPGGRGVPLAPDRRRG